MKSLFGFFVILISLFFNLKSAIAFDYAPEIGDLAPSFHFCLLYTSDAADE